MVSLPKTVPIVEYGLLNLFKDKGFDLNIERDNKSVYDPSKIFEALDRYHKPIEFNFKPDILKKAKDITFKHFAKPRDFDHLTPLHLGDDLIKIIHEEKSSGLPFMSRKGEVFDRDLALSKEVLAGRRAPPPCVPFHRIQHGESGPKTRLVWGYPQSMTLLEACFARPLIKMFLSRRTSYLLGLKKFEVSARLTSVEEAPVRYAVDYSKYDSTVSADLIDYAFGVLKTYFDLSPDELVWYNKVINYFIHTPIIMPEEVGSDQFHLVLKHRGIPSGSEFTQLVGSIINCVLLQYAMLSLSGKPIKWESLVVLGDDSAFGFDQFYTLEQISGMVSQLGVKVGLDKSFVSWRRREPVPFLGHSWLNGIPDREEIEVVKRMVFPERISGISDTELRQRTRVFSYLSDAACAIKLVRQFSRYKGPDRDKLFFSPISPIAVTGYQEFLRSVLHQEDTLSTRATKLGYLGLAL